MPELIWKGKKQVINHHFEVPVSTLNRLYNYNCDKESANKIIHGDNLVALKALLPQYEGRVKCIYIDPPYNTGNESWMYNDNVKDPRIVKWLGDVVGKEGEDLCRHDKWLCMMYPRLQLLKRLLADDGVIFVSIDDNEIHNLRPIMNEIFGANNLIENFIWKKSYGGGAKEKFAVTVHEYVLLYAKKKTVLNGLWLPPDPATEKKYYKHEDSKVKSRGPYRIKPLEATKSMDRRENLIYPIPAPDGTEVWPERQWWWSKKRSYLALKLDELVFSRKKSSDWTVSYKQYLLDENGNQRKAKPFSIINDIYTQKGTADLVSIFSKRIPFQFPKPTALVELFITMIGEDYKDAIILDSFAGSGTTAHAVLNLNKKDGGTRKFILIEMMDYAESITAERVKRVIDGYGKGKKAVSGTGGDFSYYILGERIFDDEGNLNESIGVAKIRDYVARSETLPGAEQGKHPYWLGEKNRTDYYFYYEPEQVTVLNLDFLATMTQKNESYLIYADICLLDKGIMVQNHIRFKKIPRDISRF